MSTYRARSLSGELLTARSITAQRQTFSDINISTETVHWELYGMDFNIDKQLWSEVYINFRITWYLGIFNYFFQFFLFHSGTIILHTL